MGDLDASAGAGLAFIDIGLAVDAADRDILVVAIAVRRLDARALLGRQPAGGDPRRQGGVGHVEQAGVVLGGANIEGDVSEAGLDDEVTDGAYDAVVIDEVGHALARVHAVARELAGDAVGVQAVEVAAALGLERGRQVVDVAGPQVGLDLGEVPLDPAAVSRALADDVRRGVGQLEGEDQIKHKQHPFRDASIPAPIQARTGDQPPRLRVALLRGATGPAVVRQPAVRDGDRSRELQATSTRPRSRSPGTRRTAR